MMHVNFRDKESGVNADTFYGFSYYVAQYASLTAEQLTEEIDRVTVTLEEVEDTKRRLELMISILKLIREHSEND